MIGRKRRAAELSLRPRELSLHRPEWDRAGAEERFGDSRAQCRQLLQEIIELEARLERASGADIDLALLQTYREMIDGRRALYRLLDP